MALYHPSRRRRDRRRRRRGSLTRRDRDVTGLRPARPAAARRRVHDARAVRPDRPDRRRGVARVRRPRHRLHHRRRSAPTRPRSASGPGLYGSFFIGLGVVIVAIPLGIAAAVYLEEYAKPRNRLTRFIHGQHPQPRRRAGGRLRRARADHLRRAGSSRSRTARRVIAAGLTMAVLVLPIVIITSMEAIRAVPQGLRDAGYGVGASRWEITRDHVLPYAAPGILTGTVLSIARALGEAAPLILIGAITGPAPARPALDRAASRRADPDLRLVGSARPAGREFGWSNAAAAAGLSCSSWCCSSTPRRSCCATASRSSGSGHDRTPRWRP